MSRSVVCWASLGALLAVAVVSVGVAAGPGVSFQVSVLLLTCAALMRASASVAGEGTRPLASCVVRVGRPVGSALRKAGGLIGLHASGPGRQRVAEASINHPALAGWEVMR